MVGLRQLKSKSPTLAVQQQQQQQGRSQAEWVGGEGGGEGVLSTRKSPGRSVVLGPLETQPGIGVSQTCPAT